MNIVLNDASRELEAETTLLTLIENLVGTTRGSAVVVDGAVIPRAEWRSYAVRDGQRVEVIGAVQGG